MLTSSYMMQVHGRWAAGKRRLGWVVKSLPLIFGLTLGACDATFEASEHSSDDAVSNAQTVLDLRFVEDPKLPQSAKDHRDFNDKVLPKLQSYLGFWEAAGASVKARNVRYFIGAPKGASPAAVMTSYFGRDWEAALRTVHSQLTAAKDIAELRRVLDQQTCRFPLILDHFRHQLADATRSGDTTADTIGRIQTRSAAMVEEALSGDATRLNRAMVFVASPNADYSYTGALACDYVRLSHESGSFGGGDHPIAVKEPSFLSVDTVLHETGHGLHLALWSKTAPLPSEAETPFLHEAFADIFATSFSANPCYTTTASGGCLRRMDAMNKGVFEASLDLIDPSTDAHVENQAVRNFLWLARAAAPEAFPKAYVTAVQSLDPILRAHPNDLGTGDPFLEMKNLVERSQALAKGLFSSLCVQIGSRGPCGTVESVERFLGRWDQSLLDALVANAPSTIGLQGRDIQVDGQRARIRFSMVSRDGETLTNAVIDSGAAKRTFQALLANGGAHPGILFMAMDPRGKPMIWTSEGKLAAPK
jgi:hypothetical protein